MVGQLERSASVTVIWPFINISIHLYITLQETTLSPYWAHVRWWICLPGTLSAPKKAYHRSLLLLGAILKFHCQVHHFVATLTLTARSTGLPCGLVTWHLTIPPPQPLLLYPFFQNIKMWKLFEDHKYKKVFKDRYLSISSAQNGQIHHCNVLVKCYKIRFLLWWMIPDEVIGILHGVNPRR
jgi:hypothetical protein